MKVIFQWPSCGLENDLTDVIAEGRTAELSSFQWETLPFVELSIMSGLETMLYCQSCEQPSYAAKEKTPAHAEAM